MPDPTHTDSPYEFAPKTDAAGAPPPAPPPPAEAMSAAELAAAEELAIERTCPHCGFRIIGKPRGGRCPECAAALDEVATDLLQFADARWLAGMSNGVLVLAASAAMQVAAVIMVWVVAGAAGNVLHAAAAFVAAAGVWMATISEPGAGVVRTPLAPLARALGIVVAGLWIAGVFYSPQTPTKHAVPVTVAALLATGGMAAVVGLHLRSLAMRVPNDSLANQSVNVGMLIAAMCVFLVVLQVLGVAHTENLRFFFCAFPMILGMGLLVAWAMLILVRMAMELRHCAVAGHTIVARQALRAQAAEAALAAQTARK